MKNIFLFNIKFRVLLTEIPPMILLLASIIYNHDVDTLFKLYPLIIVLSAIVIFIPVYFVRGVIINYDELRCVGAFSSRFRAFIDENMTLVLTCMKKRTIKIELFDKSGSEAVFSWMKNEPEREINIFRANANGTEKTAAKILAFFCEDKELAENIIKTETSEINLGDITLKSVFGKEKGKELIIHFNEIK